MGEIPEFKDNIIENQLNTLHEELSESDSWSELWISR